MITFAARELCLRLIEEANPRRICNCFGSDSHFRTTNTCKPFLDATRFSETRGTKLPNLHWDRNNGPNGFDIV